MESCVVQNPSIINSPIHVEVVRSNVCEGKLLQERDEAWMCSEDCVHIINVNKGLIIQEWKCNYGKIYLSAEILCNSNQFIVVAARISSEASSSVVIVLTVESLIAVKLIYLPDEVTCISSVTIEKECCGISSHLRYFDGILAIGSYGGRVYLLDLAVSQFRCQGQIHHPTSINVVNDNTIPETALQNEHSALLLFQGNPYKG